MTFLTNPATTPFLIVLALKIGSFLGFRTDIESFYALIDRGAGVGSWVRWLFSDAAPSLVSGLFIIGAASAFVGYFLTMLIWRWWIARKWRRRPCGEPDGLGGRHAPPRRPAAVRGRGPAFRRLAVLGAGRSGVRRRLPCRPAGDGRTSPVRAARAAGRDDPRDGVARRTDIGLMRAALDCAGPETALALTDGQGELVCANRTWGQWFGGGAAPAELADDETTRQRLQEAGAAARRDGGAIIQISRSTADAPRRGTARRRADALALQRLRRSRADPGGETATRRRGRGAGSATSA
jgi:hypothetical protein